MDGQAFLRETAGLIESGWCRGAGARDCYGDAVAVCDPTATAWSLAGAVAAVSERPDCDGTCLRDALWSISGLIPDSSLDAWNERTCRTDTLQMLAHAGRNLNEQPAPSRD